MARSLLHKIFLHDKWNIGVAQMTMDAMIGGASLTDDDIAWLPERPGHYSADPFLFEHAGRTWLFYEDYLYRTNTAGLAVVEVLRAHDGRVSFGQARQIIAEPFHQSYPYIFCVDDVIYALPEQSASGRVQLYRATTFPYDWTPAEILFDHYPGVDATPFYHDGRWWLFVSELGVRENTEFELFFAPSLQGPWQKHPQSPVDTTAHGARMAGPLYKDTHGRIYRMGQDCRVTYGGGIVITEILTLTPQRYEQKVLRTIAPFGRYHAGIHTLSHLDDDQTLIAIDAKRWADPWEVLVKLLYLVKEKFFGTR